MGRKSRGCGSLSLRRGGAAVSTAGPGSPPVRFMPHGLTGYSEGVMLTTLAIVLLLLWMLGMLSSYTLSGFIHVLLVVAVIMVLVRIIQGRKPVG